MFACDWGCWWKRGAGAGLFFATLPVAVLTLLLVSLAGERRADDNGVSKIAPSAVVDGQLLPFAMIVYLCVPGMFIEPHQRGRDVLSTKRRAVIACGGGSLMLPRSIASFVAIMLTARYF